MPRGRPRGTGEVARARAEMEAERQKLREQVSKLTNKKDPFPYAFEAACVLYTLERGTRYQRANCHWRILDLRKLAQKNGPTGILRDDVSFLNAFIARHAPGWNWREQIGDGELARQNERIVKEQVWLERKEKARRSKFVTPDDPDRGVLLSFLTIRSSDPATWPSLRDLKLATAIGERQTCRASR